MHAAAVQRFTRTCSNTATSHQPHVSETTKTRGTVRGPNQVTRNNVTRDVTVPDAIFRFDFIPIAFNAGAMKSAELGPMRFPADLPGTT